MTALAERRPYTPPLRHYGHREAPLGTIRVRRKTDLVSLRYIKVRHASTDAERWTPYARWWWEQVHGPVPTGKRLVHKDGNGLNDSPDNLVIATPAEALALWAKANPVEREAIVQAMHRGAGEHNRLRARLVVATGWVMCYWYPVDLAARRVYLAPRYCKFDAFRAMGIQAPRRANGQSYGALFGWPDHAASEAACLAALVAGPATSAVLTERANALRARFGLPPLRRMSVATALLEPRRAGLVASRRGGCYVGGSVHALTSAGRAAAGEVTPFVTVRGRDLAHDPRYADFVKVHPDGKPVERMLRPDAPAELAHVLARCASCGTKPPSEKSDYCVACDRRRCRNGLCACGYARELKALECPRCGATMEDT